MSTAANTHDGIHFAKQLKFLSIVLFAALLADIHDQYSYLLLLIDPAPLIVLALILFASIVLAEGKFPDVGRSLLERRVPSAAEALWIFACFCFTAFVTMIFAKICHWLLAIVIHLGRQCAECGSSNAMNETFWAAVLGMALAPIARHIFFRSQPVFGPTAPLWSWIAGALGGAMMGSQLLPILAFILHRSGGISYPLLPDIIELAMTIPFIFPIARAGFSLWRQAISADESSVLDWQRAFTTLVRTYFYGYLFGMLVLILRSFSYRSPEAAAQTFLVIIWGACLFAIRPLLRVQLLTMMDAVKASAMFIGINFVIVLPIMFLSQFDGWAILFILPAIPVAVLAMAGYRYVVRQIVALGQKGTIAVA